MLRSFFARHRAAFSISLTTAFLLASFAVPSLRLTPAARAQESQNPLIPVIAPGSAYRQTNLISDSPGIAPVLDPLLVNPWGLSLTASSPFWVANNGTSTTQLIRGDVGGVPVTLNPNPQTVTIPGGLPTGTVANNVATEFVLPGACAAPPCGANFLFASITGNITGWDPNAPAAGSTTAVIAASHPGHVYTGLAIANNGSGNFLYAADFANGEIDVFNSSFALQPAASFPFADPTIPSTPGNTFHPYNIQAIGSSLYVAYAKVGTGGLPEDGVGNGFVRRFNANGVRDLTFGINNGALNSPWAVTQAPASFGIFGGALLVGNFGEGNPSIHAYNPTTGAFLGTIQDESGNGIVIDELWDLKFGNGGSGGDVNTLYFTAGIGEEEHGLFGKLNPTTASATSLVQFSTDDYAIGEGGGHIDITVTRSGDVSGAATVNYATFDQSQPGHASQKSDYEIALGTLRFDPGSTSETFRVLLVDDEFDEGSDEVIDLVLSNPTGAGVGLGTPNTSTITVLDDDAAAPTTNPIDEAQFFVRQHYLDFLNREPDAGGLSFWSNIITSCGADAACVAARRVQVSAAFFLSLEFQDTGLLALLANQAAFGTRPLYGQFMRDVQALQKDFVFGAPGSAAILEANKQQYFDDFVTRPEFVAKYPSTLTNEQYVDNLLASAGLSPSQVRLFVVQMTNSQEVPPAVPTASGGGPRPASFGTARLHFNSAQTAMTFTATVNNIDFTGAQTPADTNDNLTVAHIHASATFTPTTNSPVVWGFFGTPFNDNNPNDQQVIPFTSGVGGTINGKWDAPEGNGTTLAAQLSNLREGRAYVNFHTAQFPGGEIRGNLPAADSFRNSLIAGLDGATETRATVLRKVAEAEELKVREFNASFVLMEYFGYLRRDPDTAGFNFWLNKLNSFNGDFGSAGMVEAFITSIEYRQRFGP
ncbi:MAG TPA: TIGR03118 family protein [Pyrinomonadaceae bacterium]|nr:TIGR03118 family protein [Pyrinomonadaceae bacterium]